MPLAAIAAAEGTPLYVYSAATLRERYRAIDAAFGGYPHALHYALKANSTLAIARLLRELGSAVDANSVWEIEVARKAGFHAVADRLHRRRQVARRSSNAPSALGRQGDQRRIGRRARARRSDRRRGWDARRASPMRVNPDIDAKSHPHISTGLKINKFGVPLDDARALLRVAAQRGRR